MPREHEVPMSSACEYVVVVGSSRGLGAALVEEYLRHEHLQIIGIARSALTEIEAGQRWLDTGRYLHLQLDITAIDAHKKVQAVTDEIQPTRICVVFNAAVTETDINVDRQIDYDVLARTNQVGITGLANIIRGVEQHIVSHGGLFVGISSFSAISPGVSNPKIAYPACKAYLDMVLRCLRLHWGERAKVVVVHLGHLGDIKRRFIPTYKETAAIIVRQTLLSPPPREINIPIYYHIFYNYIFPLLPESICNWLLRSVSGNIRQNREFSK